MTRTLTFLSLRRLMPLPLLALAALAHAGHWVTTYSGGTGTDPGGTPHAYTFYNGSYGGGGIGASGTITATLTWTADHPGDTSTPPSDVYVLESCSAGGLSDNGGGRSSSPAAADNGLGSGTVNTTQQLYGTYVQYSATSQGIRLTKQSASSGSITVTATPQAAGGISAAVSYAVSIPNRGVTISSEYDPCTAPGPHDEPIEHVDPNLLDKHLFTAVTDVTSSGGTWGGNFNANLFGPWYSPSVSWSYQAADPLVHYELHSYSLDDLKQMIAGQPKEYAIPLTVTDSYGSATAKMTAHVYPQRFLPTDTSNAVEYGLWYDASPTIDLHSYSSPQPVTITNTASLAVTTGVTLSVSADLSAEFLSLYTLTLKPSVSWNWGETATMTSSVSSGYTPSQLPPEGVVWQWRIVRRVKFRHARGVAYCYGAHGYTGLDNYDWIGFVSSSKEQAAMSDYEQDEKYTGDGAPQ